MEARGRMKQAACMGNSFDTYLDDSQSSIASIHLPVCPRMPPACPRLAPPFSGGNPLKLPLWISENSQLPWHLPLHAPSSKLIFATYPTQTYWTWTGQSQSALKIIGKCKHSCGSHVHAHLMPDSPNTTSTTHSIHVDGPWMRWLA